MRTLKKRLAALELPQQGPEGFEVWVGTGDDDMLGPNGEIMSRAEFEVRYPDAIDMSGPVPMREGSTHERT